MKTDNFRLLRSPTLNPCTHDRPLQLSQSTELGRIGSRRLKVAQRLHAVLVPPDIKKRKLRPSANSVVPYVPALSVTATRAPGPVPNGRVLGATTLVQDLKAPTPPKEIQAASTIQVLYKRALRRRAAPAEGWSGTTISASMPKRRLSGDQRHTRNTSMDLLFTS